MCVCYHSNGMFVCLQPGGRSTTKQCNPNGRKSNGQWPGNPPAKASGISE